MAAVNLIGSYNYAFVALSVLIAMFASYAALDLAGRVTAAGGWTRAVWLLGGAGAMGTGIWSMHYIGMLAFILPIPVAYHWPTVLLSLLAAILASVIALYVVSRKKMGRSSRRAESWSSSPDGTEAGLDLLSHRPIRSRSSPADRRHPRQNALSDSPATNRAGSAVIADLAQADKPGKLWPCPQTGISCL